MAVIKDDAGGAFVMIEREDAIKNRTEDMDGAGLETSRSIKQQIHTRYQFYLIAGD